MCAKSEILLMEERQVMYQCITDLGETTLSLLASNMPTPGIELRYSGGKSEPYKQSWVESHI